MDYRLFLTFLPSFLLSLFFSFPRPFCYMDFFFARSLYIVVFFFFIYFLLCHLFVGMGVNFFLFPSFSLSSLLYFYL